ncbi:pH-response regulator protein palC [Microthyrium microscopicum]|uniref:pH-response regulator protein palC n=1 Tax=Microthyrium microscopicum TaxID=703497 RepID=A0A6A6UWJ9_9PEZI|nr:pH-response regulator protein palC [Microthyrium microscopicum]
MPFPFVLPTTSHIDFSHFFSSNTHPSLPIAASNARTPLRDALKSYKRIASTAQSGQLGSISAALETYIPYLFALETGLSGGSVDGEEIDVVLLREPEVEWRPTLTSAPLGREPSRAKLSSLDSEIFFVLQVMAYVQTLLARDALRAIYRNDGAPPEPEARAQTISKAMKHLLDASSIHKYLFHKASTCQSTPNGPADISSSVLNALASLALAEATLIAVLKDDPYPVAVAEERNKSSKDWMFKAPDLKASRLNLLVRICMGAAEHAGQAAATLRNAKGVDEDLVAYVDDLRRTARAKAARFQGIGVEAEGKIGEGISLIRGAKKELGFSGDDEGKVSGLSKLKRGWQEKKEEKKVRKGDSSWGADGGRFEEGRVLDMLEKKWVKANDTYSMHLIPSSDSLMTGLPSGRDFHKTPAYATPSLAEDILARMRAPPDPKDLDAYKHAVYSDDSSSETEQDEAPGAYPGTVRQYSSNTPYY